MTKLPIADINPETLAKAVQDAMADINQDHTRESVLSLARERFEEEFEVFSNLPPVRESVGFPVAKRTFREPCQVFASKFSSDGTIEIFINPLIGDKVEACFALARGMCLATGNGDKRKAKRALNAMFDGDLLLSDVRERIVQIASELPDYPHAAMNVSQRKKQTTRMLKIECGSCGFTVRASRTQIECIREDGHCWDCGETNHYMLVDGEYLFNQE